MKKWFLAVIFSSLALAGCKDKEDNTAEQKDSAKSVETQPAGDDATTHNNVDSDSSGASNSSDTGASIEAITNELVAMRDDTTTDSMDVGAPTGDMAVDTEVAPASEETGAVEVDQAVTVVDSEESDESDDSSDNEDDDNDDNEDEEDTNDDEDDDED